MSSLPFLAAANRPRPRRTEEMLVKEEEAVPEV